MARGMRKSKASYATRNSAGADLKSTETITIKAGERKILRTELLGADLELARLSMNLAGLVLPRSGLALHHGITVLNAPGLIDPDFMGNVGVILLNTSDEDYSVTAGDKIAQLLIVPFHRIYGATIEEHERGTGGFGSTGR